MSGNNSEIYSLHKKTNMTVKFSSSVGSGKENYLYSSGQNQLFAGHFYQQTEDYGARYLPYRDIPNILKKYNLHGYALDYGCGTGFSSRFLLAHHFKVSGIDTNISMLKIAKKTLPQHICDNFFVVQRDMPLPVSCAYYNLVLSSFVLFEQRNKSELFHYLMNAKKSLKSGGYFIAITGSEWMYEPKRRWLHCDANFPENNNLISGNIVKVQEKYANIIFEDFYWTTKDYHTLFINSGFEIIETHYPLGKLNEPFPWMDELYISPFVIFVLKKPTNE